MKHFPLLSTDDDDDKKNEFFVTAALSSFLFVMIVMIFWRNCIPFSPLEVWYMGKGSTLAGVLASWPIFLWGGGLTFLVSVFTTNERKVNREAEEIIVFGTAISIWAGVAEEICFRWWFFYGEILGFKIVSLLTCGLVGWIMTGFACPLANFFTLHALNQQLIHPIHWAVGAAIIGSNGKFRNGHAYLGFVGLLNSWFIGMFFFWLVFNYGLAAAIISHFIYDQIIFTIRYLDACQERARGIC